MKATTTLFSLIFSLAACGTAGQSDISGATAASEAQARNKQDVTPKLSSDRISAFTDAFASLDSAVIATASAPAFATNAMYAAIDVSSPIRSASFGHTTTVRIPAGVTGKPVDPNAATEFYVLYGRSTNTPAASYGPFTVTENGLAMVAARVDALKASASALEASCFSEDNRIAAMPADARFADIDATPVIQPVSFRHTVTVRVPAGVTGEPADADLATVYYVQLGASTNTAGGLYGPFSL